MAMVERVFETKSGRMQPMRLMTFQAPFEDIERIMGEVVKVAPLVMGKYDGNAWQSAPGVERYRPLEGAAVGAEAEVRRRPGIVEVSFELPEDQRLIEQVIETIFEAHSYQEPV